MCDIATQYQNRLNYSLRLLAGRKDTMMLLMSNNKWFTQSEV